MAKCSRIDRALDEVTDVLYGIKSMAALFQSVHMETDIDQLNVWEELHGSSGHTSDFANAIVRQAATALEMLDNIAVRLGEGTSTEHTIGG